MMLMGRVKASGASRIIRAAESASGMSVPEVESVATVTGTLEFFFGTTALIFLRWGIHRRRLVFAIYCFICIRPVYAEFDSKEFALYIMGSVRAYARLTPLPLRRHQPGKYSTLSPARYLKQCFIHEIIRHHPGLQ